MLHELDELINISVAPRQRNLLPDYNLSKPIFYSENSDNNIIRKIDTDENQQLPESNEHKDYRNLPLFASLNEIHEKVGPNIRYYFMYGHVSFALNFIIGCLALIFFSVNLKFLSEQQRQSIKEFVQYNTPFSWLSIELLDSRLNVFWILILILTSAGTLFYTFLYQCWVQRIRERTDVTSKHYDATIPDDIYVGKIGRGENAFDFIDHKDEIDVEKIKNRPFVPCNEFEPPVNVSQAMTIKHNQELSMSYLKKSEKTSIVQTRIPIEEFIMNGVEAIQITEQNKIQQRKKYIGRFFSGCIFLGLLIINSFVNYVVYTFPRYDNQYLISIALSGALTLFNIVWKLICHRVTKMERHEYYTDFYRSYFVKTYCFRICSTMILFGISRLSVFSSSDIPAQCQFSSLSQLYTVTLFSELASAFWNSIILKYLMSNKKLQNAFLFLICKKNMFGDDEYMPEFVLVEEYVDLLYKQLLVLLGVTVFPLMALGMSFTLLIKLFLDRVQLKWYCRKVAITNSSFKTILIFLNFLNVFLAVFLPPTGVLWIVLGKFDKCNNF